jgi:pyrroloquinoline quinone biosynthesis protein D
MMDGAESAPARAPAPAPARLAVEAGSVLRLPRHVKLRHDATRGRWVILAPERVLVPDDTAVAVLQRLDGVRSVLAVAEDLAATYAAPVDLILADCLPLLQDLADRGFVALAPTSGGSHA